MMPNFNNPYGHGLPGGGMPNLTPEQQKQKDDWELEQKRKIKAQWVKQNIRQTYVQLLIALAASNIATPTNEQTKQPEAICREAMEIAKWGAAIWMEENPEDSPDNVEDVIMQQPPPFGGY